MENKESKTFAEQHPKLNFIIGFTILAFMFVVGIVVLYLLIKYLGIGASNFVDWLSSLSSKLDAVVIVALITGSMSILGVIISKYIDYRKAQQEYLAKKREGPYGQFVEMVYKIQANSKKPNSYTEQQMLDDISKFSQQITLWGSTKVARKWIKFRENGTDPESAKDNLFVLESIMNEMRKDLGVKKMKKGDLLAFFINDIKQVMKSMK